MNNIYPMRIFLRQWVIHDLKAVGMIVSSRHDGTFEFVILTMDRDFLSLEDSIMLAKEANQFGRRVVFVPTLLLGRASNYLSSDEQYKLLIDVASHSQDDVTTAVLAARGSIESTVDYRYAAIAYTYNQCLNNDIKNVVHAEKIMADFFRAVEIEEPGIWWLMLLEPCYDCLSEMVNANAGLISYYVDHKQKWNTPEYLALKQELSRTGQPVYTKEVIVPMKLHNKYAFLVKNQAEYDAVVSAVVTDNANVKVIEGTFQDHVDFIMKYEKKAATSIYVLVEDFGEGWELFFTSNDFFDGYGKDFLVMTL